MRESQSFRCRMNCIQPVIVMSCYCQPVSGCVDVPDQGQKCNKYTIHETSGGMFWSVVRGAVAYIYVLRVRIWKSIDSPEN